TYIFDESTSNFFVTYAEPGEIRINRENSKIEQKGATADVILEVENVGNYEANLEEFYVNTEQNTYEATSYISGSSILRPGEKATVRVENVIGEFNPAESYLKGNLVGVKTSQGVYDEVIFSYNSEDYKLSILNEDRRLAPENLATSSPDTYRFHIPVDYKNTKTYAYTNETIKIRLKNRGSKLFGID
ncbi:unnamed protein product, partial [marine sediment metagenome]